MIDLDDFQITSDLSDGIIRNLA